MTKKMPVGRRFQKGKSGNAGGRPKKVADVVAAARERSMKALETLERNMDAPDGAVRNTAAKTMLEWGFGKPPQAAIHDVPAADALVPALEQRLAQLALDGDREALLQLLRAKMPEVYGDKASETPLDENDTVDWVPQDIAPASPPAEGEPAPEVQP